MVNEKLKSLNENYINQSWQPTVDDYREIAPGEDLMNYSFNYSRMVDGKVTIITGASDGMGFKMAELYAQHGAKVIMITSVGENEGERVVDAEGQGVVVPDVPIPGVSFAQIGLRHPVAAVPAQRMDRNEVAEGEEAFHRPRTRALRFDDGEIDLLTYEHKHTCPSCKDECDNDIIEYRFITSLI